MQPTDYAMLCMDAHGVLIDRDSAIMQGLAPLLAQLVSSPSRDEVLTRYIDTLHALTDEQMGTVSAHCVVYRALAEQWGLAADWQAGIEFASMLGVGSIYEDAPGAIQYLRKFYRLRIVTSLDEREFAPLDQRIGLAAGERLTTGSFVAARAALKSMAGDPDVLLLTAGPVPANCRAGHCRITRQASGNVLTRKALPAGQFVSLTGFIHAHQLALRREFL